MYVMHLQGQAECETNVVFTMSKQDSTLYCYCLNS